MNRLIRRFEILNETLDYIKWGLIGYLSSTLIYSVYLHDKRLTLLENERFKKPLTNVNNTTKKIESTHIIHNDY